MRSLHLYCTVVDNFGDIGVCWRLVHQLALEYSADFRLHLWVDDWAATQQIIPELPSYPDLDSAPAWVDGVQIRPWAQAAAAIDLDADCTGDVLIEAFACTLPEATLAQLAARAVKPLWINLDYFSAEDWVTRFHLQSGYDAATQTRRWFFFPGVHAHSGGMLRERDLLAQRDAWEQEAQVLPWLASLGVTVPPSALRILCFAYPHAPYADWLAALAAQPEPPIALLLCGGYTQSALRAFDPTAYPGVTWHNLPFVAQPAFDRLLWSADLLWVRGEDSLARALWSGKPFVWQIYPQADQAHLLKLMAWLDFYAQPFPSALRDAYIAVHLAWNAILPAASGAPPEPFGPAWARLMAHWTDWQYWGQQRSAECARSPDLARRLVDFINSTV